MSITSIIYTDPSRAIARTQYADGTESCGPYPSNDGPTRTAQDAFIAGGGSVTSWAPPVVTVDDYVGAIEAHVDATATAKAYGGTASLASYVNSSVPAWAAEATTFVAWRDAVWTYAYGELAKVQSAQRAQPSVAELIAELPAIQWPA